MSADFCGAISRSFPEGFSSRGLLPFRRRTFQLVPAAAPRGVGPDILQRASAAALQIFQAFYYTKSTLKKQEIGSLISKNADKPKIRGVRQQSQTGDGGRAPRCSGKRGGCASDCRKPPAGRPTNCEPSAAGRSWKGGARERADDVFFAAGIKRRRRSKADFAPTWKGRLKSIFFQGQTKPPRSGGPKPKPSEAGSVWKRGAAE